MNTGILDMLRYRVAVKLTLHTDRVDVYLFRPGHKLRDDHRVVPVDVRGLLEVFGQFVLVERDTHRRAAQHEARPDQHGIPDPLGELLDLWKAGEFLPRGLDDAKFIEQPREYMPVLCPVDVVGRGAADHDTGI